MGASASVSDDARDKDDIFSLKRDEAALQTLSKPFGVGDPTSGSATYADVARRPSFVKETLLRLLKKEDDERTRWRRQRIDELWESSASATPTGAQHKKRTGVRAGGTKSAKLIAYRAQRAADRAAMRRWKRRADARAQRRRRALLAAAGLSEDGGAAVARMEDEGAHEVACVAGESARWWNTVDEHAVLRRAAARVAARVRRRLDETVATARASLSAEAKISIAGARDSDSDAGGIRLKRAGEERTSAEGAEEGAAKNKSETRGEHGEGAPPSKAERKDADEAKVGAEVGVGVEVEGQGDDTDTERKNAKTETGTVVQAVAGVLNGKERGSLSTAGDVLTPAAVRLRPLLIYPSDVRAELTRVHARTLRQAATEAIAATRDPTSRNNDATARPEAKDEEGAEMAAAAQSEQIVAVADADADLGADVDAKAGNDADAKRVLEEAAEKAKAKRTREEAAAQERLLLACPVAEAVSGAASEWDLGAAKWWDEWASADAAAGGADAGRSAEFEDDGDDGDEAAYWSAYWSARKGTREDNQWEPTPKPMRAEVFVWALRRLRFISTGVVQATIAARFKGRKNEETEANAAEGDSDDSDDNDDETGENADGMCDDEESDAAVAWRKERKRKRKQRRKAWIMLVSSFDSAKALSRAARAQRAMAPWWRWLLADGIVRNEGSGGNGVASGSSPATAQTHKDQPNDGDGDASAAGKLNAAVVSTSRARASVLARVTQALQLRGLRSEHFPVPLLALTSPGAEAAGTTAENDTNESDRSVGGDVDDHNSKRISKQEAAREIKEAADEAEQASLPLPLGAGVHTASPNIDTSAYADGLAIIEQRPPMITSQFNCNQGFGNGVMKLAADQQLVDSAAPARRDDEFATAVATYMHTLPTLQLLQPLCSWIGWPARWQVELEARLMSEVSVAGSGPSSGADFGADSQKGLVMASHFDPRPSNRLLRIRLRESRRVRATLRQQRNLPHHRLRREHVQQDATEEESEHTVSRAAAELGIGAVGGVVWRSHVRRALGVRWQHAADTWWKSEADGVGFAPAPPAIMMTTPAIATATAKAHVALHAQQQALEQPYRVPGDMVDEVDVETSAVEDVDVDADDKSGTDAGNDTVEVEEKAKQGRRRWRNALTTVKVATSLTQDAERREEQRAARRAAAAARAAVAASAIYRPALASLPLELDLYITAPRLRSLLRLLDAERRAAAATHFPIPTFRDRFPWHQGVLPKVEKIIAKAAQHGRPRQFGAPNARQVRMAGGADGASETKVSREVFEQAVGNRWSVYVDNLWLAWANKRGAQRKRKSLKATAKGLSIGGSWMQGKKNSALAAAKERIAKQKAEEADAAGQGDEEKAADGETVNSGGQSNIAGREEDLNGDAAASASEYVARVSNGARMRSAVGMRRLRLILDWEDSSPWWRDVHRSVGVGGIGPEPSAQADPNSPMAPVLASSAMRTGMAVVYPALARLQVEEDEEEQGPRDEEDESDDEKTTAREQVPQPQQQPSPSQEQQNQLENDGGTGGDAPVVSASARSGDDDARHGQAGLDTLVSDALAAEVLQVATREAAHVTIVKQWIPRDSHGDLLDSSNLGTEPRVVNSARADELVVNDCCWGPRLGALWDNSWAEEICLSNDRDTQDSRNKETPTAESMPEAQVLDGEEEQQDQKQCRWFWEWGRLPWRAHMARIAVLSDEALARARPDIMQQQHLLGLSSTASKPALGVVTVPTGTLDVVPGAGSVAPDMIATTTPTALQPQVIANEKKAVPLSAAQIQEASNTNIDELIMARIKVAAAREYTALYEFTAAGARTRWKPDAVRFHVVHAHSVGSLKGVRGDMRYECDKLRLALQGATHRLAQCADADADADAQETTQAFADARDVVAAASATAALSTASRRSSIAGGEGSDDALSSDGEGALGPADQASVDLAAGGMGGGDDGLLRLERGVVPFEALDKLAAPRDAGAPAASVQGKWTKHGTARGAATVATISTELKSACEDRLGRLALQYLIDAVEELENATREEEHTEDERYKASVAGAATNGGANKSKNGGATPAGGSSESAAGTAPHADAAASKALANAEALKAKVDDLACRCEALKTAIRVLIGSPFGRDRLLTHADEVRLLKTGKSEDGGGSGDDGYCYTRSLWHELRRHCDKKLKHHTKDLPLFYRTKQLEKGFATLCEDPIAPSAPVALSALGGGRSRGSVSALARSPSIASTPRGSPLAGGRGKLTPRVGSAWSPSSGRAAGGGGGGGGLLRQAQVKSAAKLAQSKPSGAVPKPWPFLEAVFPEGDDETGAGAVRAWHADLLPPPPPDMLRAGGDSAGGEANSVDPEVRYHELLALAAAAVDPMFQAFVAAACDSVNANMIRMNPPRSCVSGAALRGGRRGSRSSRGGGSSASGSPRSSVANLMAPSGTPRKDVRRTSLRPGRRRGRGDSVAPTPRGAVGTPRSMNSARNGGARPRRRRARARAGGGPGTLAAAASPSTVASQASSSPTKFGQPPGAGQDGGATTDKSGPSKQLLARAHPRPPLTAWELKLREGGGGLGHGAGRPPQRCCPDAVSVDISVRDATAARALMTALFATGAIQPMERRRGSAQAGVFGGLSAVSEAGEASKEGPVDAYKPIEMDAGPLGPALEPVSALNDYQQHVDMEDMLGDRAITVYAVFDCRAAANKLAEAGAGNTGRFGFDSDDEHDTGPSRRAPTPPGTGSLSPVSEQSSGAFAAQARDLQSRRRSHSRSSEQSLERRSSLSSQTTPRSPADMAKKKPPKAIDRTLGTWAALSRTKQVHSAWRERQRWQTKQSTERGEALEELFAWLTRGNKRAQAGSRRRGDDDGGTSRPLGLGSKPARFRVEITIRHARFHKAYMQASLYRDICRIQPETQDNGGDEGAPAGSASKLLGRKPKEEAFVAMAVAVGGHNQLWQAMRDPDAELWAPAPFNWSLEPLARMH